MEESSSKELEIKHDSKKGLEDNHESSNGEKSLQVSQNANTHDEESLKEARNKLLDEKLVNLLDEKIEAGKITQQIIKSDQVALAQGLPDSWEEEQPELFKRTPAERQALAKARTSTDEELIPTIWEKIRNKLSLGGALPTRITGDMERQAEREIRFRQKEKAEMKGELNQAMSYLRGEEPSNSKETIDTSFTVKK